MISAAIPFFMTPFYSPPDQAGVLHTGAAHGPLAQGGAVGDGPQRLPGHVRPLRGGEHRPGVTIPDQTVN